MKNDRWKMYFEFSPCENYRVNGLCKLCDRNYKDKQGVFSNFLKHLKRIHSREYIQLFPEGEQASPVDANGRVDDLEGNNGVTNKSKQHQINDVHCEESSDQM